MTPQDLAIVQWAYVVGVLACVAAYLALLPEWITSAWRRRGITVCLVGWLALSTALAIEATQQIIRIDLPCSELPWWIWIVEPRCW